MTSNANSVAQRALELKAGALAHSVARFGRTETKTQLRRVENALGDVRAGRLDVAAACRAHGVDLAATLAFAPVAATQADQAKAAAPDPVRALDLARTALRVKGGAEALAHAARIDGALAAHAKGMALDDALAAAGADVAAIATTITAN